MLVLSSESLFESAITQINALGLLRRAWVIQAEDPEMVIEIKFSIFDLEYEPTCDHDYVAIYGGWEVNAMLMGKFCGSISPEFLKSTTQYTAIN